MNLTNEELQIINENLFEGDELYTLHFVYYSNTILKERSRNGEFWPFKHLSFENQIYWLQHQHDQYESKF